MALSPDIEVLLSVRYDFCVFAAAHRLADREVGDGLQNIALAPSISPHDQYAVTLTSKSNLGEIAKGLQRDFTDPHPAR